MNAKNAIILTLLVSLSGCYRPGDSARKPKKPVVPDVVVQVEEKFDPATMSAALARLAERQAKSASVRDGSRRLHGVLNELVADGVPKAYVESVRAAVRIIKPPTKAEPARNLTPAEIESLRAVK